MLQGPRPQPRRLPQQRLLAHRASVASRLCCKRGIAVLTPVVQVQHGSRLGVRGHTRAHNRRARRGAVRLSLCDRSLVPTIDLRVARSLLEHGGPSWLAIMTCLCLHYGIGGVLHRALRRRTDRARSRRTDDLGANQQRQTVQALGSRLAVASRPESGPSARPDS